MNVSIIRRWLGYVILIEGVLMLLPCAVALACGEREGLTFLIVAAGAFVLGTIVALPKPKSSVIYLKEGCVATALSWIALSLVGCLPFWITGVIPHFTDALFETVSGFTTTGASILPAVEGLPKCILVWRSFTHWIGGMGILVFILAILPLSAGSGNGTNINLLRAESPGPSVGKLMPKMHHTAAALYGIYVGLSVLMLILLMIGGLSFLDAMMLTFGTAGTGGFGILNDSIASYSPYIQWVIIVFMALFGVNFGAYFLIITRRFRRAFAIEEVRWYIGMILLCTGIIFLNLRGAGMAGPDTFRESLFQVVSLVTTTGYSTADFDTWPQLSRGLIILLTFVGACSASTGGGFKTSRIIILLKSAANEVREYVRPNSVKKIKIDGKPLDKEMVRSTTVYFIVFVITLVASFLLVSLDGHDVVTNFTAVLTTLDNVGPGLNDIGPSRNFADFSDMSKIVLIFDMLAGRLELFPILVLFSPSLWAKAGRQHRSDRRLKRAKK